MEQMDLMKKLAELSKLELDAAELAGFAEQMGEIMELMDRVKAFHEPEAAECPAPVVFSELREDAVQPSYPAEAVLAAAEEAENQSFIVPKIV